MSKPAREKPVTMVDLGPLLAETETEWRRYIQELWGSRQFILGEQLRRFEQAFAQYLHAKDAVGCGCGTSALELCLRAAGVTRSNQKVLTPAFTSPFTAQAIFAAGARPAFADVDPDTLLLNAAQIRRVKGLAAILPVHLYGQPCELPAFRQLAASWAVALIQDACQAHGATYRGKPFTHFSNFVAYSFYPTKNLGGLGDGGAIATNSSRMADRLRLLRDGGRRADQLSRIVAVNSRLDDLQACFLRAFLPQLDGWNRDRARLAQLYDEGLRECPDVQPVKRLPGSVNHLYVIRVPRREKLRAFLSQNDIQTAVHYPTPLHLQPAFFSRDTPRGSLPHAERAAREVLSLPLRPYLGESNVHRVVETIRSFYR